MTKTWPAADVRAAGRARRHRRRGEPGPGGRGQARRVRRPARCGGTSSARSSATRPPSVAAYADVVHSVDRAVLVDGARPRTPARHGRRITRARAGGLDDADRPRRRAAPTRSPTLAAAVAAARPAAPRGRDGRGAARRATRTPPSPGWRRSPATCAAAHPEATVVSAGMSGDLDAAIRHGATHVRIGTALLGHRSPTFG